MFYYGTNIVTSLTKCYHQQHYSRNYSVAQNSVVGDFLNLISLLLGQNDSWYYWYC